MIVAGGSADFANGFDADFDFDSAALTLFREQASRCAPYREYVESLGIDPAAVRQLVDIPFLPIEVFKSRKVYYGATAPEAVFTSSGAVQSHHYMASLQHYETVFTAAFEQFYGAPRDWNIYALLPGYLERRGSSLVYMLDRLIAKARGGGFYLNDYPALTRDITAVEGPRLLLGVSFALLDLAEFGIQLPEGTVVMETGGMKGRREELPREELHRRLREAFGVSAIHSEYGMAELTSQAYSAGGGVFCTPPWMRVLIRDLNAPFSYAPTGAAGGVNLIDLANTSSCAFIQTQDRGVVHADGSFSIDGRITGADIRGCNLLIQ